MNYNDTYFLSQSVPKTIIERYEIDSMTLDYYQEFTKENILQSFTYILTNDNAKMSNFDIIDCQHLLQFEIDGDNSNIMKGMTRWRLKHGKNKGIQNIVASLTEMSQLQSKHNTDIKRVQVLYLNDCDFQMGALFFNKPLKLSSLYKYKDTYVV